MTKSTITNHANDVKAFVCDYVDAKSFNDFGLVDYNADSTDFCITIKAADTYVIYLKYDQISDDLYSLEMYGMHDDCESVTGDTVMELFTKANQNKSLRFVLGRIKI